MDIENSTQMNWVSMPALGLRTSETDRFDREVDPEFKVSMPALGLRTSE